MRAGEFPDGAHVLRLRIDMASPNLNLRDPVIYRIRHARHHRTGDKWCLYPLYDYTHCISDALERVTHSICTLEFQDHRPLYDWVIEKLADGGRLPRPLPQQYEFARLNLTYVVLSKRKLLRARRGRPRRRLGRSPDADARRRAPARIHAGGLPAVRRAHRRVEVRLVDRHERARGDDARRSQRERRVRRMAVLDPIRLVIDNYPEGESEECARAQPSAAAGSRPPRACRCRASCGSSATTSPRRRRRAISGCRRAPKCGCATRYIVRCTGFEKDDDGNVTTVHCTYDPATRSGTPGADARKVKGNIHWLSVAHAVPAEVRLYDRLFRVPFPGARTGGDDRRRPRRGARTRACRSRWPARRSMPRTIASAISSTISTRRRSASSPRSSSRRSRNAAAEERFQFERHGYFVADLVDHRPGRLVFNRTVTLRDSWTKKPG